MLARWSPDSTTAIDMVVGSVFRSDPRREFGGSSALEDWVSNVDNAGTDLSAFIRKQTRLTLAYGSSYTFLNLPARPEGLEFNSLEEEIPFLRPILKCFNPLELLNWEVNLVGELVWALFVTKEALNGKWFLKWYEITSEQVAEWVLPLGKDGDPELLVVGQHGLGFVPIVPGYFDFVEPMIGRSYIEQSAMLDLKKFVQEADLEYDRFMLAHPQMMVKAKSEIGAIEVDATKYLKLNPEEDAQYITLDKAPYEVNKESVLQTRMDIARKLRIDPLGFIVQQGKIELSGISRQLSFALHQSDTLTSVANIAETHDSNVLRMAFRILEAQDPVDVSVAYDKDFSLAAIDTQMSVYNDIGEKIPSKSFHDEMLTRFAAAMVGNIPKVIEAIELEIRSSDQPDQDTIMTSVVNGHSHSYEPGADRTGVADGHSHEVINGVVQEADNHTHALINDM